MEGRGDNGSPFCTQLRGYPCKKFSWHVPCFMPCRRANMNRRRRSGEMLVRDAEIDALLDAFTCDPRAAMNERPAKRDAITGNVMENAPSTFSQASAASNQLVEYRNEI